MVVTPRHLHQAAAATGDLVGTRASFGFVARALRATGFCLAVALELIFFTEFATGVTPIRFAALDFRGALA